MKQITIDPITRLEGHGKIDIFLNDDGEVKNVYFLKNKQIKVFIGIIHNINIIISFIFSGI